MGLGSTDLIVDFHVRGCEKESSVLNSMSHINISFRNKDRNQFPDLVYYFINLL